MRHLRKVLPFAGWVALGALMGVSLPLGTILTIYDPTPGVWVTEFGSTRFFVGMALASGPFLVGWLAFTWLAFRKSEWEGVGARAIAVVSGMLATLFLAIILLYTVEGIELLIP